MAPITSNPLPGVGLHAVGAFFAATCYTPQKQLRRWAWKTYWLTQASFCWFLLPILGGCPSRSPVVRCSIRFYNLDHLRMGHYKITSWAIHMIMLVLFSNLVGVALREWRTCRRVTHSTIGLALLVLVGAVLLLTYGNDLGELAAQ